VRLAFAQQKRCAKDSAQARGSAMQHGACAGEAARRARRVAAASGTLIERQV